MFGGPLHGTWREVTGVTLRAAEYPELRNLIDDGGLSVAAATSFTCTEYRWGIWTDNRFDIYFGQAFGYEMTDLDKMVLNWHLDARGKTADRRWDFREGPPSDDQLVAADLLESNGFDEQAELLRRKVVVAVPREQHGNKQF